MKSIRSLACVATGVLLLTGCVGGPIRGDQPDGRYCIKAVARKLACTTGPVPTAEQEGKAKQFAVEPGKHVIWLVRDATYDSQRKLPVTIAGRPVETLPYTQSRVIVQPGPQTIALNTSREASEIRFDANAGEQTFVELAAHIGIFSTTVSLHRVSEAEGRTKALAGKLINDIRLQHLAPQ